jgi:hypothetical protein
VHKDGIVVIRVILVIWRSCVRASW